MVHPGDCGVLPSLESLGLMTGGRANLMAQWGTASIVGVRRSTHFSATSPHVHRLVLSSTLYHMAPTSAGAVSALQHPFLPRIGRPSVFLTLLEGCEDYERACRVLADSIA